MRRIIAIGDIHGSIRAFIEITQRLGIADREMVQVSSRRGTVEVRARVTEQSPSGLCWMALHFHEASANVLPTEAGDPITDGPINPQEYLDTRGRDAVQRYLVKEGIQWRAMPCDFPPFQTVHDVLERGEKNGATETVHD